MSHYVVMLNEEQFLRLQAMQEEVDAAAAGEADQPERIYHDVWAPCETCGEDCEYGVPVRLDSEELHGHTHGIMHPNCADRDGD